MRSEAVLVVDDTRGFIRTVERAARHADVPLVAAMSSREALVTIHELGRRLRAALLDYHLADGTTCLELLPVIRCRAPRAEFAVISGYLDSEQAEVLRSEHNLAYWEKTSIDHQGLVTWLGGVKRRSVGTVVALATTTHALTPTDAETLERAMLDGCEHDLLAGALGIEREGVRSRIKRLLAKTGDASLRELVDRLENRS